MAAKIFSRLTSIHGRRIAMSATGAMVDKNGFGAVVADASGVLQSAFKSALELISSSGAVLGAVGLSVLSSATAAGRNFTIAAPSSGQGKEIFSLSSATTIIIETTAASILFVTPAASSSKITFDKTAGVFGESVLLRGLSSTRWAVLNKTGAVT